MMRNLARLCVLHELYFRHPHLYRHSIFQQNGFHRRQLLTIDIYGVGILKGSDGTSELSAPIYYIQLGVPSTHIRVGSQLDGGRAIDAISAEYISSHLQWETLLRAFDLQIRLLVVHAHLLTIHVRMVSCHLGRLTKHLGRLTSHRLSSTISSTPHDMGMQSRIVGHSILQ